jgi:hypothetical protein
MYASVRRYKVHAKSVETLSIRVGDQFVPIISTIPGFVSYMAIDAGDGVVASISVFESQEAAERSDKAAADWVKDNLADIVEGPPEITAGEILVAAPRPAVW